MVIWNSTADSFVVQNPPTAQNWLIGSTGPVVAGTDYVGPHDPGIVESHGIAVQPRSLYQAQLQERLAYPNLDYREYWVGDIDGFASTGGTGNNVTVDSTWRTQFDNQTTAPLTNFDNLTNPQAIPFTFNFSLAPGEQVVGATLSLGLRATSSDVSLNRIYLDSVTDNPTFSSLGWNDIATTGTTAKVLNLASRLSVLQDGRLNIGILQNTAIDWAVLNLQVAPSVPVNTTSLYAEADATVRGGIYANQNFGSDTVLSTKEDSSADTDRRSFLRFNLSSIQGEIVRATLKLVPTSVGATIENSVAQVINDTWSESTINWNNQPTALAFGSSMVSLGDPFEILVTPLAQQSLNTDRKLSLRIESTMNIGGPGVVSYASRENSNINFRPLLVIEVRDAIAPTVTNIIASGSAWSAAFIDAVDGGGTGAGNGLGYSLTTGFTLPNLGINRIYIQFSEPVTGFNASTFVLLGVNVANYAGFTTVTYDAANMRGFIQLSNSITKDKLRIGISDTVKDAAMNPLDGDSNGSAGGVLNFRFNVLVGDANNDGSVNGGDLPIFSGSFNKSVGNIAYNPRADWNVDGSVNGGDLPLFSSNFNQSLPAAEPGTFNFPPPPLLLATDSEQESSGAPPIESIDEFFLQLKSEDELNLSDDA